MCPYYPIYFKFPHPKGVKDIQRFLGVTNFYRSFIKGHSNILAPLINLTKKGVKFTWDENCQAAFENMKVKLTTAPVRNYYDPDLPVILTCDASGRGIGATISQLSEKGEMKLVGYGSKIFKPSEMTWSVTEKEVYSIVFFIKKYKHFLSRPFMVFSDHGALRYISNMRDASGKISRWLNFISQFSFTVHHRPGNSPEMVVADILSRMMMGMPTSEEEDQAIRMEKPLLKMYKGPISPVLWYWFRVEPAEEGDFEKDDEFVGTGKRSSRGPLRVMLKKLQKCVDKEWENSRKIVGEMGQRVLKEEEVEYLQ